MVLLITIIAIILICKYPIKKKTKRYETDFFYSNSEISTNKNTDSSDATENKKLEPKQDINNATYKSADFRVSKDAALEETTQENDLIY